MDNKPRICFACKEETTDFYKHKHRTYCNLCYEYEYKRETLLYQETPRDNGKKQF